MKVREDLVLDADINKLISVLCKIKESVTRGLLDIGKILSAIKRDDLFYPNYDSFEEFLAIPELSFSRSTAYKAMAMYLVFEEKYRIADKILDIESDKLNKIIPILTDGNVDEWIDKARALSRSDLIEEIKQFKGESPTLTTTDLLDMFFKVYPNFKSNREVILLWETWKRERSRQSQT